MTTWEFFFNAWNLFSKNATLYAKFTMLWSTLLQKIGKFLPFKDLETAKLKLQKALILPVHSTKENEEKAQFSIFLVKPNTIDRFWQLKARFAYNWPAYSYVICWDSNWYNFGISQAFDLIFVFLQWTFSILLFIEANMKLEGGQFLKFPGPSLLCAALQTKRAYMNQPWKHLSSISVA